MKITVFCVGKIKEKYFVDAIMEYKKRLSRYAQIEIVEVADEKTPANASEKEELLIKEKEGDRLLSKIPEDAYCITLAILGKMHTSEELSGKIQQLMTAGNSHICFVIGGSLGLSDAVLKRADESISFSKMTFPHQLMRVILIEQIYRSFRIMNNEPYHK